MAVNITVVSFCKQRKASWRGVYVLGREPSGTKGWIQFYFPSFQLLFTCLLGQGFVDHMSGADTVRWLFVVISASPFFFFFSLQVPTASRWKSTRKCSCCTVCGSEVEQMGERKFKEPSDNPQWSKSELFTSFNGMRKTTQYRVQSCSQSRNHTVFQVQV